MRISVNQESYHGETPVAWAGHYANLQPKQAVMPAITSLPPLFLDEAKSVPMIRHLMDVIKKTTEYLNPGQAPVIAVDQPLSTVAKQIQWNWPESHDEQHVVFILGGLHIEMATLSVLGNWLEDSGWTSALVQANIASPGVVNSFVKGSNVKRTRRAH